MNNNYAALLFLLLHLPGLSFCQSRAQGLSVEATIVEATTLSPIAYATILNQRTKNGTVSNFEGLFRLEGIQANDTLTISYIGYDTQNILAADAANIDTIFLQSKAELLEEIVVRAENSFLYNLISKCRKTQTFKPLKAKTYFELKTDAGNRQVELLESYYNGGFSGYDVGNLDLKNGRIHLAHFGNRYFVSTESSKALHMHALFKLNPYFPSSPFELSKGKLKKHYKLKLVSKYKDDKRNTIYVIKYTPRDASQKFFAGQVWVDSLSGKISKVNLNISDAAVYPFAPIWSADSLEQVDLEISKTYQEIKGRMYVHSIDFNYKLRYQASNFSTYDISTHAVLYVYDYNQEFTLPFFEFAETQNSDYRKINAAPYNAFFWENIDEFKLNDQENKNELFVEDSASITDQTLFLNNDYFERGLFEHPYVSWSERRIQLKAPSTDTTTDYASLQRDLLAERYKFKVQIYLDANVLNDSLHCITQTVFDPFGSFYKYPLTPEGIAFINLYFDLMEVQRRALEKEIQQKGKDMESLKEIYAAKLEDINSVSNTFFKEVNRGLNKKATRKWSDYINVELGINNVKVFKLYQQK